MQKNIVLLLLITLISSVAFAQDTLWHIDSQEQVIAYSCNCFDRKCGYITGQNCYLRDNYAEKYRIKGKAEVIGVLSYHTGYLKNGNRKLVFDIRSVGTDHLPADSLGGREMSYRNIFASGNPVYSPFYTPVEVSDSFFVNCNFLLYAHEPLTDTIAVMSSLDGTRPDSDLSNIGTNALKIHDGPWKDLYQQTGLKIHLALFPIIKYKVSGNVSAFESLASVNTYPNPCQDEVNVSFFLETDSNVKIQLKNPGQQTLITIDLGRVPAGFYNEKLNTSNLTAGLYLLSIESDTSSKMYKLIKRQ